MDGVEKDLRGRAAAAVALASFILMSVTVCYRGRPAFYEMSFLSNVAAAGVLIAGGAHICISGRDIDSVSYLDAATLLLTVTGVCTFFSPRECFTGPSVLIHLIDPLSVTVFYLWRPAEHSFRQCATALVFPVMYYIFMTVFGAASGRAIYTYFDTTGMSAIKLLAVGVFASLVVFALAAILAAVNRLIHINTLAVSAALHKARK